MTYAMKKILILLLLIITFSLTFAQDTLQNQYYRYGAGVAASLSNGTRGINFIPYITLNWPNHKIGIGPLFGQKSRIHFSPGGYWGPPSNDSHSEPQTTLKGATFFYRYLPSRFGVQMSANDDPNTNIFVECRLNYSIDKFFLSGNESNMNVFEGLIGLGCRLRLFKWFVLSSSFLELGYIVRVGAEGTLGNEEQDYKQSEIAFGFNLGLDYNFGVKSR
jgi:hypothetical protein